MSRCGGITERETMTKERMMAVFVFAVGALPLACSSQTIAGSKCASASGCARENAAERGTAPSQATGEQDTATILERTCARAAECGMLDGQTQEECIGHEELGLQALRERSGCDGAAEALLEADLCAMKLSCDEVKVFVESRDHKCKAAMKMLPAEKREHCLSALY
jgi:hypothetical protein